MSLTSLWLKSRKLFADRDIRTGSDLLSALDEIVDERVALRGLTSDEGRKLRSDLLLCRVVEDVSARESILAGINVTPRDFLTEFGRERLKVTAISSSVISGKQALQIRDRFNAIRTAGKRDPLKLNAPLDAQPQLGRLLSRLAKMRPIGSVEEVALRLGLSEQEASNLMDHASSLFELVDLDIPAVSADSGLSQNTLSRARRVAKELLSDRNILFAERDRANFEKVLDELNVPPAAVQSLQRARIDSFARARLQGQNLAKIKGIEGNVAHRLVTHTRLAAISSDLDLNKKLVANGIQGTFDLANRKKSNLPRAVEENGKAASLLDRARGYRSLIRTTVAGSAIAGAQARNGFGLYDAEELTPPLAEVYVATAEDGYCDVCEDCRSVLGPASYLTDLVDFVKDCFPQTFSELTDLDGRFYRSFSDLLISCEATDQRVRQIEIANEVLEQVNITSWPAPKRPTRTELYARFRTVSGYPEPEILEKTFDAYLGELGTTRGDIQDAADDPTKLEELAERVGLDKDELLGLKELDPAQITIDDVDELPRLLRIARTKGIDEHDPMRLADYQDALARAESAVDRVKEYTLVDIRSNLIHAALTEAPGLDFSTAKELGNHLHIDLSVGASVTTTSIANAIETLQSFVLAYQRGREPDVQLAVTQADFEARWRWTQSYGLWHAGQMVYFFPENFLFPKVRRSQTPQFRTFLEAIEEEGASPTAVRDAVRSYESSVVETQTEGPRFTATLDNRSFLFYRRYGGSVQMTEQESDGGMRGLTTLDGLPADQMLGAVGFNGALYLFFRPTPQWEPEYTSIVYARVLPDAIASNPPKLESSGDLGTSFGGDLAIIANPEGINLYFRYPMIRDPRLHTRLDFLILDRFHRWSSRAIDLEFNPYRDWFRDGAWLEPIGHLDGSEYIMFAKQVGDTSHLLVMRIDEPYADPTHTNGPWADVLLDFELTNFSPPAYAGMIRDGKLVLFRSYHRDPSDVAVPMVAVFTPNTAREAISWRELGPGDVWPASKVMSASSVGEALVLHTVDHYLLCRPAGTSWEVQSQGSSAIDGFASTVQHPVRGNWSYLDAYRQQQERHYATTAPGDFIRLSLDEWYFFIPLAAAKALSDERHYEDALGWLHLLYYPYQAEADDRLIYSGFNTTDDEGTYSQDSVAWLRDPFDPHTIARTRSGAYLCHTIFQYIANLLDWADAEFTRDTAESIARARELYELAEDILQIGEIPQDACATAWRELWTEVYATHSPEQVRILQLMLGPLQTLEARVKLSDIADMRKILDKDEPFATRLTELKEYTDKIEARENEPEMLAALEDKRAEHEDEERNNLEDDYGTLLERRLGAPALASALDTAAAGSGVSSIPVAPEVSVVESVPSKLATGFCVPHNPIVDILRWRIDPNLEKIRTNRNFVGMQRQLRAYASPGDPILAVQRAATGEAVNGLMPSEELVPSEPPPIYRFSHLIERARYYVQVAQQLETLLLSAFEKGDQERYSLLRAKQDLKTAQANLAVQALRIIEARDGIDLAMLQQSHAQLQESHFAGLLREGLLPYEQEAIKRLWQAHDELVGAAAASGVQAIVTGIATFGLGAAGASADVARSLAALESTASQARSLQASYERRAQEWEFQHELAAQDVRVGVQGVTLASDRLAITEKEGDVARLHSQYATEVVNFLGTKFTSRELWDWMRDVLRRYYRDHLDLATATARMAQRALEFERQKTMTFVAPYYSEQEREDLTSAEQLLTDINNLDQHRLTTEKRRKELTEVISLGSSAPIEFQQLREQGWVEFATPMEWFDRRWPGHYLRLIKNMSLTVVGLISPREGIHATLSNKGISRVVVGPPFDGAKNRVIQRQPESIAVSIPSNGSGLFEVRLDDPILLPFEGHGVDSTWTLEMPKGANRFDYDTLVDVLLTIRYTALDDVDYRDKIVRQMAKTITQTMSTSFRNSYPDAWYHLNNPIFLPDPSQYGFESGKQTPPYAMEFEMREADFPPNEATQKLLRLNVALRQEKFVKVPIVCEFKPEGSEEEYVVEADFEWDPADMNKGPISLSAFSHQRPGPNDEWVATPKQLAELKPFGRWRMRLNNGTNVHELPVGAVNPANYPDLFTDESPHDGQKELDLSWLKDALFVVTYEAEVEYKYAQ